MNNRESSESNAVENARIRCDAVEYRKGFIEVLDNIHQGLVNVETWQVGVDVDISAMRVDASDWQEHQIQSNTELELTPVQARRVAYRLLAAADAVESCGEPPDSPN
jgi:hypothetical protein